MCYLYYYIYYIYNLLTSIIYLKKKRSLVSHTFFSVLLTINYLKKKKRLQRHHNIILKLYNLQKKIWKLTRLFIINIYDKKKLIIFPRQTTTYYKYHYLLLEILLETNI